MTLSLSLPFPDIFFPSLRTCPLSDFLKLRNRLPILFCTWPTHSYFFNRNISIWGCCYNTGMGIAIPITNVACVSQVVLRKRSVEYCDSSCCFHSPQMNQCDWWGICGQLSICYIFQCPSVISIYHRQYIFLSWLGSLDIFGCHYQWR